MSYDYVKCKYLKIRITRAHLTIGVLNLYLNVLSKLIVVCTIQIVSVNTRHTSARDHNIFFFNTEKI